MVKESLKQKQDQESCLYMTSLSEFESYFRATYIVGQIWCKIYFQDYLTNQNPSRTKTVLKYHLSIKWNEDPQNDETREKYQ